MSSKVAPRALLVIPAAVALLIGLDAALMLLGVWTPVTSQRWADAHGILMTLGFVGALVALERSVALGKLHGYLGPLGFAVGALLHLNADTYRVGQVLLVVGALGLVFTYVPLWQRQRDDSVLVQTVSAVFAVGAAVLWLGDIKAHQLIPWLAAFLVLTIVGERLELARLGMPARAASSLLILSFALCSSVVAALLWPAIGMRLVGATFLGLTVWLALYDVARRTVRLPGLPRFMACCLLSAQAWLGVAGAVLLVTGDVSEGAAYDAVVHSIFLGYTMSMIFAHAPVILPAVTRVKLPYHRGMYVAWGLLQASLVIRLGVGDLAGRQLGWEIGGVGNVLAVLAFLLITVGTAVREVRR